MVKQEIYKVKGRILGDFLVRKYNKTRKGLILNPNFEFWKGMVENSKGKLTMKKVKVKQDSHPITSSGTKK